MACGSKRCKAPDRFSDPVADGIEALPYALEARLAT